MAPKLHQIELDGKLLTRGFWLYVWEIKCGRKKQFYYVGKTGDKASGVCQSPFNRVSAHLGSNEQNNALTRHLAVHKIDPEKCSFRFRPYGPLFHGKRTRTHGELCDLTSALEKALADAMHAAGYPMLNEVKCRKQLDPEAWRAVLLAFGEHFPELLNNGVPPE